MAKPKKADNVANTQTTKNNTTSTEQIVDVPEVTENNSETEIENGKIKIELLCDVFYLDSKLKKGEVLELEKEELEKFAESFYKKI